MLLVSILALSFVIAAEEVVEEVHSSQCNCTHLLHAEETSTDASSTFPTTSFTCWGRYDGYYADIEVDCTVFHYCQTWQFPSGLNETVKWDFACPQSTIFNQKILSCTLPNISFDCQDSPNYYWVNYNLTSNNFTSNAVSPTMETSTAPSNLGQQLIVGGLGPQSATFSDLVESTPAAVTTNAVYEESGSGQPPIDANHANDAEMINFLEEMDGSE